MGLGCFGFPWSALAGIPPSRLEACSPMPPILSDRADSCVDADIRQLDLRESFAFVTIVNLLRCH